MKEIKNIYISGATGLVGQMISRTLDHSGYSILNTKYSLLNPASLNRLEDSLRTCNVDLVIHCAGKVGGIKANSEDNKGFMQANRDMGINLINTAKAAGVPYFINLASSCAYPINSTLPLTEDQFFSQDAEYEPTNEGYALAKVGVADYLLRTYRAKGITLIPCNMYGPNDRYFKGSHIIPDLIQKFHKAKIEGKKEISLYGNGQQYRELMYVGDFAHIVLNLIKKPMVQGKFFPRYLLNVRTTQEISTMEIATKVAHTVGWRGTIKWRGELGGVKRKPMSNQGLHDLRLYTGHYTPLLVGLAIQYADFKGRFEYAKSTLFSK